MHPAAVCRSPEARLEFIGGGIQRGIEIGGAGFGTNHGPSRLTRDLHVLAGAGLPAIGFVLQLDIDPDHFVVEPLYFAEFLRNVLPVMIRYLNVPSTHDNVHATSTVLLTR
jgi:hypothetical protein